MLEEKGGRAGETTVVEITEGGTRTPAPGRTLTRTPPATAATQKQVLSNCQIHQHNTLSRIQQEAGRNPTISSCVTH